MKNFRLIDSNVNTKPILDELNRYSKMWLANTSRQEKVRCQRHTENIFLRVAKKPLPPGANNANDIHESVTTKAAKRMFIRTFAFCQNLANEIDGKLGRVMLVSLLPNSQVYPHVDHGDYYRIRDRYHLVIKSATGSPLTAGDETVVMQERELWAFNNKVEHSAFNASDRQRVHLIFDILPAQGRNVFQNVQNRQP